jgi:hypothetical protein
MACWGGPRRHKPPKGVGCAFLETAARGRTRQSTTATEGGRTRRTLHLPRLSSSDTYLKERARNRQIQRAVHDLCMHMATYKLEHDHQM